MTLQTQLNAIKADFEKQVPEESLETMHRATADLRKSGILDRIKKVGDMAPAFELNNAVGKPIRLQHLLSEGPLVLSFYRGSW